MAASGYGKAYYPLSTLYGGEQSIPGDAAQAERFSKLAFDWLHANAYLNDPEIWHDLGALCVGDHNELAVSWFQKAANAGCASSMWMLCGAYENGNGVEQDWEEALYWQIKAAEVGHENAQRALEMQHEHGNLASKIDDKQVLNWYVWSAEHGHVWAQLFLADAYFHGENIDQNAEEAAHWYLQAANQGEQHAQLQLGKMYWEDRLDGRGIEPDDTQARYWLEKASEHNEPESQYELGLFLYEQGAEEEGLAVHLIQSAANQGYGPAQYFLSFDVTDVTEEQCQALYEQAFSWYEEHARFGDAELRLDHALMHLNNLNPRSGRAVYFGYVAIPC